jgi:hypothetical protein
MNTNIDDARTLSDDELLARVKGLAARARDTTAELIAHLGEVEARGLHLASGYGSLFVYCRDALHLSEHAAYHRVAAARAARRFPVILDRLAEAAVNLTTVRLLSQHLTDANHLEVLESARGRGKGEVKRIVARLAPAPDVPTLIRKLSAPRSVAAPTAAATPTAPEAAPPIATPPTPTLPTPAAARTEARPEAVSPLSPDRYKLQLTIGGDTLEKLELAKDMLRHAVPSGDVAQIFERALTSLLDGLARKKFAATDRPRASSQAAFAPLDVLESRYIPAEVKRVVWVRDLGRCAFVGRDGHRCHERSCLEFHHVRPFSEGGLPTVDNIELRCRAHNNYEWHLRSTDARRREEEWRCQQLAAGVAPWTAGAARHERARHAGSTAATSSNTSSNSVQDRVRLSYGYETEGLPSRGDIRVTPGGHSRTPI